MRIETVVVNASPLITLFRSGQAELLPRLFKTIVVPEAVWQEVVIGDDADAAARDLPVQTWPLREAVIPSPRALAWNLGAGETAVLSHALSNPPQRAIIDDAAARRCAQTLQIPLLGTGGVLLLAKRRGVLSSVSEGLEKLRIAGLWISDGLMDLLKTQAGE
ncbi:MAG: DUF3368 domain-containing protein [Candidatus Competibacteraceae bacterium]